MGKRHLSSSSTNEPAHKRLLPCNGIVPGEVLKDKAGKDWKLGKAIGQGAFGDIFLASENIDRDANEHNSNYVAKIELHSNGPLFVEVNCYLRLGKLDMINDWKSKKNLQNLGMVNYVSSGWHYKKDTKYRFLILPRFNNDLESVLGKYGNRFNLKTVITIGLQLLDTLEYIHENGFVHADIKASNIVLGKTLKREESIEDHCDNKTVPTTQIYRINRKNSRLRTCRLNNLIRWNLRLNENLVSIRTDSMQPVKKVEIGQSCSNQVYLLDFGLACKYVHANGDHKEYCTDNRKAHAGTILFCSLDAHNGAQSRRSDLECLGYNIIYWLTSSLPWSLDIENYETVKRKKENCFRHIDEFLKTCFKNHSRPNFLSDYFYYLKSMRFEQKPNYGYCRKILKQGLLEFGYKSDNKMDFENKEGWGCKIKSMRKNFENKFARKIVVNSIQRAPLRSNIPLIKPVLRAKNKNKKKISLNWSKILMDPENILKTGKKSKELETGDNHVDNLNNLNIQELNPTEAMLSVYNNFFGKPSTQMPKNKGESSHLHVEGYTQAMLAVYSKILERKQLKTASGIRGRGRQPQRTQKIAPEVVPIKRKPGRPPKNKRLQTRWNKSATSLLNKNRPRG